MQELHCTKYEQTRRSGIYMNHCEEAQQNQYCCETFVHHLEAILTNLLHINTNNLLHIHLRIN